MAHVKLRRSSSLKPWCLPSIALSMALLLAVAPHSEAKQFRTPAGRKKAEELFRKAAASDTTAYGVPQVMMLNRTTSVDHFGSVQYIQNDTFELRYMLVHPTDPPTADTPIFLFCGGESPLTEISPGPYFDYASSSGAVQIWPEHRYYAETSPHTPVDNLAHFTIEQALVDYIELVLDVQQRMKLTRNPVIAIGSSYSGQLSSWLRMRYPDVIAGAISSSPTSLGCPGLGLDPSYDPYGFAKVATRTASSQFGAAEACPGNVQKFFRTIFDIGLSSSGLDQINQAINLCSESQVASYEALNSTLASYFLKQWISASQANAPVANYGTFGAPANRVRVACESLSDSSLEGDELMAAMVRALAAFSGNATVTRGCLDITDAAAQPEPEPGSAEAPAGEPAGPLPDAAPEAEAVPVSGGSRKQATPAGDAVFQYSSDQKFAYQICNQDQTPASYNGVTDMFYDMPFNLDDFAAQCYGDFGIRPQYNWAAYNFGLSAIRQSSNIFFTNGLYDPFIACGPTKDITDTITAFVFEGCHAYDMSPASPVDPPSVIRAREQGIKLINQWVEEYNILKTQLPLSNAADLFELSYSLGGYTDVVNDTLVGSEAFTRQDILEPSATVTNVEKPLLG